MSGNPTTPTTPRRAVKALALTLAAGLAASCGAPDGDAGGGTGGDAPVRMAVNGWVGYEASAAVLSHLIESELGGTVEKVEDDEETSWHRLAEGEVDVILENWGHQDLMDLYGAEESPLVVDGGPNGNDGRIGWYVPEYVVDEYPEVATYEGLAKHTDLFRTGGGDGPGRFLGADPTFVTQDQGMINHFGLDLEIEYAGSEEEQLEEVRAAYEKEEPVLFYFYEPQWMTEEMDLVKVEFPEYVDLCEIDPDDVACDYPEYELNKVFAKPFADGDSPAYRLLENWQWTNEDQNEVAEMIAGEGMAPEEAAAAWVEENPDVWREWIPEDA
ncbi:glycine/betaine ABC transporter substrate-binding protein [Nocardiopsis sp. RSe5-2]|uniref:Glycine/betaine ABC transporter substrate-binding protein n=1 Tax=Nocardiopsis endophytica TaxID=3018445 RepID=A0ABT4TY80_9ACTN|nr:glycine betaine ABC transporter substrate-binding protein [Nocardiopsis endophytica]MDA2809653.1 glycine/betaine ABC transporter substrate-binding protein [Nocardiopsis endophytica]